MKLAQTRIVTADVAELGAFYARLVGKPVVLNDYYVEVPTGAQRIGLCRARFSDLTAATGGSPQGPVAGELILDFAADDLDAEHDRVNALGVEWVMRPALQPWGRRSMMLRDPDGHLINVYSTRKENAP